MARPIEPAPVLYGEDARRLKHMVKNPSKKSPEAREFKSPNYGGCIRMPGTGKNSILKTRNTAEQKDMTEEMIKKHCGAWKDSRSAEEIINDIMTSRTSSESPLSFD